jgi:hypothetical protein
MLGAQMRILAACPGMREVVHPFPHLELKLRKGVEPAGRPLSAEIVPWLEPYLYGGLGSESLPLPLQSGKLAAWEKWSGTVSLPATFLAVRPAGNRTEARRLKGPDAADPDGGRGGA